MYHSFRNQLLSILIVTFSGSFIYSGQPTVLRLTMHSTRFLILKNDLNRTLTIDGMQLTPGKERAFEPTKSDFITKLTAGLSLLLNVGAKSRKIEIVDGTKKYLLLVKYRGIMPECHVKDFSISKLLPDYPQ